MLLRAGAGPGRGRVGVVCGREQAFLSLKQVLDHFLCGLDASGKTDPDRFAGETELLVGGW